MRRLELYSSPRAKKMLTMKEQTIKIGVWKGSSNFLLWFCIIERWKWKSGYRIEGLRETDPVRIWKEQICGSGEGGGKMSSCDCLRGGKRMWRIHLEGWYHKRLSEGSKIASQAKGRKTWLLSMAITLTLPFPTPTWPDPTWIIGFWVTHKWKNRAVNTRVNDIYYFNNFQRNKENSS